MTTVRNATVEDIAEFTNVIRTSILVLCQHDYTSRELSSLLAQYPGPELYARWLRERVLLVAQEVDRIVGFAQYFPSTDSIEAVHVLPEYARRGVGRRLIERIEEAARARGASKLVLESSLNAVGFYERCGYARGTTAKYRCKDGVELAVVVCEKDLVTA